MTETEVIAALQRTRVVPVASLESAEEARLTAAALSQGGIRCIEVTFRTADAEAALAAAREVEGMIVGAGTVLSGDHARAAVQAGADFAVAPGSNPEVIDACAQLGLPFFPGVATPSEIEAARARGGHTLKVFPAAPLGGPAFLRAVAATYRDVRFIPTGGIGAGTLPDYLALDCVLAVGGSWMVDRSLIRAGRYDEIERLAGEAVRHGSTSAAPAR